MGELDGFVVFRNEKGNRTAPHVLALMVSPSTLGLSMTACQVLSDPVYGNVFFDERRRRMMVSKAEPDMPNAFMLAHQGGERTSRRCLLSAKCIREKVETLAGFDFGKRRFLIRGKSVGTENPALIFELADLRKEVLG